MRGAFTSGDLRTRYEEIRYVKYDKIEMPRTPQAMSTGHVIAGSVWEDGKYS